MVTEPDLKKDKSVKSLVFILSYLIRQFNRTEATKEDEEMLWAIYYKLVELDPKYEFFRADLAIIKGRHLPPGVSI